MVRRSSDDAYGLSLVEADIAETFEAEFPVVTGRTVKILSVGESPDRVACIDGIEVGIELTSIRGESAGEIVAEVLHLATKKHESYERRNIFDTRPIILLGRLEWPGGDVEGPALYDVFEELTDLFVTGDFDGLGFSEIWAMDNGAKYTSRRDPRAPADFFCFAPGEMIGFYERERKRRPYWGLVRDFLT